ncbi:MAG TPA: YkgJ family cysteine cluster protein [Bryobacteraceae bacterium]|nr:YkgJ family cysteine cluster protein [Bryobacteraceae bacterium]
MITDLVQVQALGAKKRDENFRFRRFMKSRDHSDRILRRIAEGIQTQIDCTACANCCKTSTTEISDRDIERLARHLRISREQFLADYTMPDDEGALSLKFTPQTGCVFLDGNLCSVYDARPDICQRYPHLVRGNGSIASRMWQFVDRAEVCPIVYNSLEAFKAELRFRR